MTSNSLQLQLQTSPPESWIMSVSLNSDTPVLQLAPEFGEGWPFRKEEISRYDDRGPPWYHNNFSCCGHTSTHFDAPIDWVTGEDYDRNATDTIDWRRFIAPARVIDYANDVAEDDDCLLTPGHIRSCEAKHGCIPANNWGLFRSNWSSREPNAFLNMRENGADTPGPSSEVVKFMVEGRDVLAFGTETVGTDAGQGLAFDPPFPCHASRHDANKFGVASLTNLDKLPPPGAVIVANQLKIEEGSGSPCRVAGLIGWLVS